MNPFLPERLHRGVVLASRSPRRADILTGLGFEFDVDPASEEVEQQVSYEDAFALPEELARRKCAQVAARRRDEIVIAADTVVILGDEILTKPGSDEEAVGFLRKLSGQTHTVVTGVAVEHGAALASGAEHTRVTFRELSEADIAGYVATGEGRDKAGSYAAQGIGAGLIRRIDGCYFNVVGLPVSLLIDLLKEVAVER